MHVGEWGGVKGGWMGESEGLGGWVSGFVDDGWYVW